MRAEGAPGAWRASLLAAALLAAGCHAGLHYRPDAPVPATVDGIGNLELLEIQRDAVWTELRLRWQAVPGVALTNALLAPPEAAPCTAGMTMTSLEVDGQQRWDRPIALGADHLLTIRFANDSRLASGPMMADLAVATGTTLRCARLVVAAPDRRLRPVAPLLAETIELSLAGSLRLPADDALTVAMGFGLWIGPLRLTLGLGATVGSARVSVGGTTESSRSDLVVVFMAPEAAVFPLIRGRYAWGLSGSYLLGSGWLNAKGQNGTESNDAVFGPRLSLQLVWITPRPLGAPLGGPLNGLAVALFLARQSVWAGQAERGGVYVGGIGFVTTFSGGDWW